MATMIGDIVAACRKLKGMSPAKAAPIGVGGRVPPSKPSTVFEGDRWRASLVNPKSLPQTYCIISLLCATIARNAISRTLRRPKPRMCRLIKAGLCETRKTQIIGAHCIGATRARKYFESLAKAVTFGSRTKA